MSRERQRMDQVYVGVVQAKVQRAAKEGQIEALAVVGNQQVVGGDVELELVQVLPPDIVADIAAVVEDNGGDVVVGQPQAGGLDVERGAPGAETAKEPPVLARRKTGSEEAGLRSFQGCPGAMGHGADRVARLPVKVAVAQSLQQRTPRSHSRRS